MVVSLRHKEESAVYFELVEVEKKKVQVLVRGELKLKMARQEVLRL